MIYIENLTKGQQEIIKHLANHGDILDEIRFLEGDKVTMMKERLVKLREADKGSKIPWDTMIGLASLLLSVVK